jgi:hypothetical protein
MTKNLNVLILGLFLAVLSLWAGPKALAAQPAPTGITVSPAFQQVSILPNEAEPTITFKITNNYAAPITVHLSTADFDTLQETGGLFFVGSSPTQLEQKYGLAKWLKLPADAVTIGPGQTADIKAAVSNSTDLAAGGHYGALMLTLPSSTSANQSNRVAVKPVASSLIFLDKRGGEIYAMKLAHVDVSKIYFKLPTAVSLTFANTGNTHLIPRGTVEILNPSGKLVSKGVINENSSIILPQKSRKLSVPLQQVASASLSGQYKLRVSYRYDGIGNYAVKTYTIRWMDGQILALILIIVLVCVISAWRGTKMLKK